jgi:cbb3-type cytochrome oxidase subunit 3
VEWLEWFTKYENTKPVGLVIFFAVFCFILIYVYGNKERGKELESHKDLLFQDDSELESKEPK